jgi:hypothetical protein
MAASKDTTKKNHQRKASSKKKAAKKPSKYDEKIIVSGTFEELVKELITPKKK